MVLTRMRRDVRLVQRARHHSPGRLLCDLPGADFYDDGRAAQLAAVQNGTAPPAPDQPRRQPAGALHLAGQQWVNDWNAASITGHVADGPEINEYSGRTIATGAITPEDVAIGLIRKAVSVTPVLVCTVVGEGIPAGLVEAEAAAIP